MTENKEYPEYSINRSCQKKYHETCNIKFLQTKCIYVDDPADVLQQKGEERQQGVIRKTSNMSTKSLFVSYSFLLTFVVYETKI